MIRTLIRLWAFLGSIFRKTPPKNSVDARKKNENKDRIGDLEDDDIYTIY